MNAIIFHGWGASSQDNWFPWLKNELEKVGIKTECRDFPNTRHPKLDEWLDAASSLEIGEDTILIGHSLGCPFIMRLLEQGRKAKAAFLVSAFDRDLGIEDIRTFVDKPFDYEKIKKNAEKIFILNSDDDPFIKLDIAKELSEKLDCKLSVFHNMKHLSNGTGSLKFPELKKMILNETH